MRKHSEKMRDLIFFKCLTMNFVIFIIFYERMSLYIIIYIERASSNKEDSYS